MILIKLLPNLNNSNFFIFLVSHDKKIGEGDNYGDDGKHK